MQSECEHIFVVPAYGESPYLKECLQSLFYQKKPSKVVVTSSTPNDYVKRIVDEFGVELQINPCSEGISADWNFALEQHPEIPYITLAHQDDIYLPEYTSFIETKFCNAPDATICFSNFNELKFGKISRFRAYLVIKRVLMLPFFVKSRWAMPFVKALVLRFGNPISCPSVCFNRKLVGDFRFKNNFEINLDWEAWLELAKRKGEFVFSRSPLLLHRLNPENETAKGIADHRRYDEDIRMFSKLWPRWIINLLMKFYVLSYNKERY